MGFREAVFISLGAAQLGLAMSALAGPPLGLPAVPIPADNPQTPAKIALQAYAICERRGVELEPGKH